MSKWILRAAGAMLFSGLFLASPASAGQLYVHVGPPAPVVEVRPALRHGYVWRNGYYRWNGHRYVWSRGRYVRPPYPSATWNAGRWDRSHFGYYWVPGHWTRR